MSAETDAVKAYVRERVRNAVERTTEIMDNDPHHKIKNRIRERGGHIPSRGNRSQTSRRSLPNRGDGRSLTPEDINDFEAAAEKRPRKTSSRKVERLFEDLWSYDYWRMRRLRKDMEWLRRKAREHGVPEWNIPWHEI